MKDTRQASQCDCAGQCDLRAATQCLYRTTIDILSRAGDGPLPDTLPLLRPMSTVVGRFKSRQGQDACAAFALAMAHGDGEDMLDICRRLMDLADAVSGP